MQTLNKICLTLGLIVLSNLMYAQYIDEVKSVFDQTSQLMVISYDIKNLSFKKNIQILPTLYYNNDSTDLLSSRYISGDYGWINHKRKSYTIYWDAFKDGKDNFSSLDIKMKYNVKKANIPRRWNIAVHGSNSAPFGLKLSSLSILGWYATFRVGNLPPSYKYTVQSNGEIEQFRESGVYQIGSQSKLSSYGFSVGPILQLDRKLYTYAGIGLGKEQLFWQYDAYNLNKELTANEWALNESINNKGLFIDLGLIYASKIVSYDLGFTTNSLQSFQIIGGIGISFNKK